MKLKEAVCSAGVLRRPNGSKLFYLASDWSQKGMGALLGQKDERGLDYAVAYASKSCNPAEKNYSSFDGECLGAVWATSHFKQYVIGKKLTLVTDHEPIKWILSTEKLPGKLARWALLLQEFDFKVEHRAGAENDNADCFSRFPMDSMGGSEVPDWERGDITFRPETLLAMMALGVGEQEKVDETTEAASGEVWADKHLLEYL